MKRVIIETNDLSVAETIDKIMHNELYLLKKASQRVREKIENYENRHGSSETIGSLYGRIDDMDLIEWEGELETLARIEKKMSAFENVHVEIE